MDYELKRVPAKTADDRALVEEHDARLADIFNLVATSGLRAGLDKLKKESGGKFSYQISEIFSIEDPSLLVSTNIPVINGSGAIPGLLRITVKRDGQITAYGDDGIEGPHEKVGVNGDAAPVVEFVERKLKAAQAKPAF